MARANLPSSVPPVPEDTFLAFQFLYLWAAQLEKDYGDLERMMEQATHGSVFFRDASGWAVIPPGTPGLKLQTNGPGADPSWA